MKITRTPNLLSYSTTRKHDTPLAGLLTFATFAGRHYTLANFRPPFRSFITVYVRNTSFKRGMYRQEIYLLVPYTLLHAPRSEMSITETKCSRKTIFWEDIHDSNSIPACYRECSRHKLHLHLNRRRYDQSNDKPSFNCTKIIWWTGDRNWCDSVDESVKQPTSRSTALLEKW